MGEIFVFGSNLDGFHGKGAARHAYDHHGAIWGVAEGLQGSSYAIPTKGHFSPLSGRFIVLPLADIGIYVWGFIGFAQGNPQLTFNVTKIGCGLARYTPRQIGPLFRGVPANVILPPEFAQAIAELEALDG